MENKCNKWLIIVTILIGEMFYHPKRVVALRSRFGIGVTINSSIVIWSFLKFVIFILKSVRFFEKIINNNKK